MNLYDGQFCSQNQGKFVILLDCWKESLLHRETLMKPIFKLISQQKERNMFQIISLDINNNSSENVVVYGQAAEVDFW